MNLKDRLELLSFLATLLITLMRSRGWLDLRTLDVQLGRLENFNNLLYKKPPFMLATWIVYVVIELLFGFLLLTQGFLGGVILFGVPLIHLMAASPTDILPVLRLDALCEARQIRLIFLILTVSNVWLLIDLIQK